MIEVSKEDLAYLAGLFDGEGCVMINESTYKTQDQKMPRFQLRVTITNNDKDILDWVLSLNFGGFVANHHSQVRIPTYHFIVNDNDGMNFLLTILPYLRIKKEQAEFAIAFQTRKTKQCKWNRYNPMPFYEVRIRRIFKHVLSSMKNTSAATTLRNNAIARKLQLKSNSFINGE